MSSLRDPDMDVWGLRKEDPAWIEAPNPAHDISELLDLLRTEDDDWMAQGWCANKSMLDAWNLTPDAWQGGGSIADEKAARELCMACPVRTQCLEYAIDHDEPYGLWGGMWPTGRTRVLNQRLGTKLGRRRVASDARQVSRERA